MVEYLRRRWSELERRRPRFEFREGGSFLYLGNFHRLHLSRRTTGFDGREFLIPHGSEEEVRERLERLYRRLGRRTSDRPGGGIRRKISAFSGKNPHRRRTPALGLLFPAWRSQFQLATDPVPRARLIDYVVIHELAHLIELNHSSRFWEQVGRMCPRYRECRRELTDDAILYGGF